MKWKLCPLTWHLCHITQISHKIATLWHRSIISMYGTIIFKWLKIVCLFIYLWINKWIWIFGLSNDTLKDILLFYIFWYLKPTKIQFKYIYIKESWKYISKVHSSLGHLVFILQKCGLSTPLYALGILAKTLNIYQSYSIFVWFYFS